jgi:hypothetical protein
MAEDSNGRSSDYSFNGLFLRRFWRLQRVFFPTLLCVNSGIFLLLLLTSGLEQYLAYEVGIIAGLLKFGNLPVY